MEHEEKFNIFNTYDIANKANENSDEENETYDEEAVELSDNEGIN